MKAFPSISKEPMDDGEGCWYTPSSEGMELRDYFAAKAMQALITHYGAYGEDNQYGNDYKVPDVNEVSEYCYIQADAMLEKREKK